MTLHQRTSHWLLGKLSATEFVQLNHPAYSLDLAPSRAGFTTSRAPVQKKMWMPLIYNPPWTQWQPMTPARHTISFHLFPNHYFNISGLLPCCKKWKKNFVLSWGPLFVGPLFGRTCWTCLNLPLAPSNYFLVRNLKYRLRGTYRRRITEDRCEGMVWESKEKILFSGHKQLRTKV